MPIRFCLEGDYELIAALWNSAYPMYPLHPDTLRHDDERSPARIYRRRYLLEHDGEALGFGTVRNTRDSFHPQEFLLDLVLRPEALGRGHGRALYAHLLADIEPRTPRALFAWVREDMPRAVRFYRDRGFVEVQRAFESVLDVTAFDPSRFSGAAERLARQGIEIRDLTSLERDPDHRRKLYLLHTEIDRDVPSPRTYSKPSFEEFCDAHFNERLIPEGMLVALHEDRYIGMCELYRHQGSDDLHNGLTGVLRPWRRRGIARALKLASIEVARAQGAAAIHTWNAAHNAGMLAINDALGFERQPATADLRKTFEAGSADPAP